MKAQNKVVPLFQSNELVTNNLTTTSLMLAKQFNRSHKSILRTIENIIFDMDENELNRRNIAPVDYIDAKGEALIEIKYEQIGEDIVECVSARELYLKLGHNREKWPRWYQRNIINNEWFIDKRDWEYRPEVADTRPEGKPTKDFLITLDFAKHIAMMAKTQKGHEYRNYLINCEKRLIHSQQDQLQAAQQKLKHSIPLNPNCPKAILGITKNSIIHDLYRLMEVNGHAIRLEETKTIYRWQITLEGVDAYGGYNSLSGIRFSKEYHDALRELLNKALNADQDDLFMENN